MEILCRSNANNILEYVFLAANGENSPVGEFPVVELNIC